MQLERGNSGWDTCRKRREITDDLRDACTKAWIPDQQRTMDEQVMAHKHDDADRLKFKPGVHSGGLVDSDAHLLGTSHPQSAAAAKKSAAQASPPLKKAAKDVSWFWAVCMP